MAADPSAVIYLDHAAATRVRPEVDEAMREAAVRAFANPSSLHAAGRDARRVLEDCRERILTLLGARVVGGARDQLVFTGGATEANVLGIVGLAGSGGGTILSSARDHGSIRAATDMLARRGGWSAVQIPLRTDATLALPADLSDLLPDATGGRRILSTTLACGQTGAVEDMAAVAHLVARTPGLAVHVDATQAIAYLPVDLSRLPAATLTLAPHKFGGPRGIGGLLVRRGSGLEPVVSGPQEEGLRGGTEAVVLAVGFARALELAVAERAAETARITDLRTRLESAIQAAAAASGLRAVIVAETARRVAHITTIAFPGVDRQTLVIAADLAGVCLATGTACASGSSEPSPALVAAGLEEAVTRSAVRFSLGRDTRPPDVEQVGSRLADVLHRCARANGHGAT